MPFELHTKRSDEFQFLRTVLIESCTLLGTLTIPSLQANCPPVGLLMLWIKTNTKRKMLFDDFQLFSNLSTLESTGSLEILAVIVDVCIVRFHNGRKLTFFYLGLFFTQLIELCFFFEALDLFAAPWLHWDSSAWQLDLAIIFFYVFKDFRSAVRIPKTLPVRF